MSYVLAAALVAGFLMIGLANRQYTRTVRLLLLGAAVLGPAYLYLTW